MVWVCLWDHVCLPIWTLISPSHHQQHAAASMLSNTANNRFPTCQYTSKSMVYTDLLLVWIPAPLQLIMVFPAPAPLTVMLGVAITAPHDHGAPRYVPLSSITTSPWWSCGIRRFMKMCTITWEHYQVQHVFKFIYCCICSICSTHTLLHLQHTHKHTQNCIHNTWLWLSRIYSACLHSQAGLIFLSLPVEA